MRCGSKFGWCLFVCVRPAAGHGDASSRYASSDAILGEDVFRIVYFAGDTTAVVEVCLAVYRDRVHNKESFLLVILSSY